jgi:hypothetical protein
MPFYHDDIGMSRPQVGRCIKRFGYAERGEKAPDQIGAHLFDTKGPEAVRQREAPYSRSNLHETSLVVKDTSEGRRLRKTVHDEHGKPIDVHNDVCLETKRLREKPKGVRAIDWLPTPKQRRVKEMLSLDSPSNWLRQSSAV